jgi:DNA repair exonuclease SbcCD ATPase subunit
MGNNQSKMDALNSQMNLLVESQAQEIKELKEQNKEIKGWNRDLATQMKNHHDNWDLAMKKEEELKEQNKELNYRIDALSKMNDKKHKYHMNKCEEVKKLQKSLSNLKKENEKLKLVQDKLREQLKDAEYSFIKIKKEFTEKVVVDKEKFDYNIFLEEKTNMADMLSELHSENEKLKKEVVDEDEMKKLYSAAECLSFMGYKYNELGWSDEVAG